GAAGGPPAGWIAGLALLTLTAWTPAVSAQTLLRGRVVDDSTRAAVVGADVQVALDDSLLVGRVSTGQGGVFVIRLPRAGLYRLQVQGLGYRTRVSQSFPVPDGDTLDIVFGLEPEAITLPGLEVEADGPGLRPGRDKFEEHRALGKGYFVTRAQIDSLKPLEVGEIFKLVDGVRLNWEQATLDDGSRKLIPRVTSKRGRGCLAYLIDDFPISRDRRNPWAVFPLAGLKPQDIEAIEVYRHLSEVPPELRNQAFIPLDGTRVRMTPGARQGDPEEPVVTKFYREQTCGLVVIRTRIRW
ncbi:MAG: carboxypeptidase regulatory-like domain-containing protein, partial [Gemmatimonadetes bacterium]